MDDFFAVLKVRTDFSDDTIKKLFDFNEFLYEKNQYINLTRIKKEESVYRNFLDSLNPAVLKELSGAKKIIDIGSGSGFPGIALAIAFPEKRFTLVEATGKKAVFLKEAAEALGLKNTEVVSARAEELAHDTAYREKYDAATARAVAAMSVICELASGFAAPEGKLVFYKGAKAKEEIAQAKKIFPVLGLSECRIQKYAINSETDETYMVILKKIRKLASNYPRPYAKIIKSN